MIMATVAFLSETGQSAFQGSFSVAIEVDLNCSRLLKNYHPLTKAILANAIIFLSYS
jgi:hypothetical protein